MASQQPIVEDPVPILTLNDRRSIIPAANPSPDIDLTNIQGDIYPTFPKKSERFIFFHIKDVDQFRVGLGEFRSHITTAAKTMDNLRQVQAVRLKYTHGPRPLVRLEQYQIGFSHAAFECLNITGDLGDIDFNAGPQLKQAVRLLGDRPTGTGPRDVDWDPIWKAYTVHGVIVAASESEETCDHSVRHVRRIFGHSIHIVNVVSGCVRTAEGQSGHEHFGFMDGISQPAIRGLADVHPGQNKCDAGVILMNHKTDPIKDRPDWAKDGSFMAFRKLQQLVPEFDRFLAENPLNPTGPHDQHAIDLRGAKMVGRWKSGAPIQLSPDKDDQEMADNPDKVNNFEYLKEEDPKDESRQARCPFSAHIRKTAPRKGFIGGGASEQSLIVRAGIPYGPEVSDEERAIDTTIADRGLLFVSYQAALRPGFAFLQNGWASNEDFPDTAIGHDPIIGNNLIDEGQAFSSDRARFAKTGEKALTAAGGEPPKSDPTTLKMPFDFVVARGGEYFFIPSMSTLDKLVEGEELPPGPTPPVLVARVPGLNFFPPPRPGPPPVAA